MRYHDYLNYALGAGKPPRDLSGHGTHVGGIAAAAGNNIQGVAGANWNSPVYVARVLDKTDVTTAGRVKLAVHDLLDYARGTIGQFTIPGAPYPFFRIGSKRVVVNLSLGIKAEADALRQMCQETADGNTVVCAAAGSRGESPVDIDYPAAFAAEFSHVIAVGATDKDDHIVSPMLENYAAITIFAPGMYILSTVPTDTSTPTGTPYDVASGTSQACPMVAGAVSLMWSLNRLHSPAGIREQLVSNAHLIKHNGKTYPRLALHNIARGYSFGLWPP